MTARRRKKVLKQRGSRTYGWGLVHRGSGQKGGAGNSSRGKKANAKAPKRGTWTKQLMGKQGFLPRGAKKHVRTINLRDLEDRLPSMLAAKQAAEKDGVFAADLGKLGYGKMLGTGKVLRKWKITVSSASPDAVEKIKAAGGEVLAAKAE